MLKVRTLVNLALLLAAAGLCTGCTSGGGGSGGKTMEGAGSSFIDPLMQEWTSLYNKEKKVQVNYQSRGSGAGIEMMTSKKVDFGCSDAFLTKDQINACKENGGDVVHIPLVMGGVVPAYNLPGKPELQLNGEVLTDIYLGKIKRWNDPAIQKLNENVNLPDLEIAVVHRSDSSGSSAIWTDFLAHGPHSKNHKGWQKVGVGTMVQWPCGVGQKGNDGVAGHVQRTEGAIGYIELIYALKNNIPYAAVYNGHKAVKASMDSVTAAAKGKKFPEDLRYSLIDAEALPKDAYPISGTTWAIVYVKQPSEEQAKRLVDFLRWATHEGQDQARKLDYAPLPEELVKQLEEKLTQIH